jgi:prepilin-type N-terminal cleavage/methylation domain-containing protein
MTGMKTRNALRINSDRRRRGMTLAEVVMSIAIASIAVSGSINGYIMAVNQAECSAYSLAAQSLANQRMEQVRAAKWDTSASPVVDMVVSSNFLVKVDILDVPISGTNIVYATNYTTITPISTNPAYKLIKVDCVWRFMNHGAYSNTVVSYRAADQ